MELLKPVWRIAAGAAAGERFADHAENHNLAEWQMQRQI
jgi:hypothetical protein